MLYSNRICPSSFYQAWLIRSSILRRTTFHRGPEPCTRYLRPEHAMRKGSNNNYFCIVSETGRVEMTKKRFLKEEHTFPYLLKPKSPCYLGFQVHNDCRRINTEQKVYHYGLLMHNGSDYSLRFKMSLCHCGS